VIPTKGEYVGSLCKVCGYKNGNVKVEVLEIKKNQDF
jgi:hypothetical protein